MDEPRNPAPAVSVDPGDTPTAPGPDDHAKGSATDRPGGTPGWTPAQAEAAAATSAYLQGMVREVEACLLAAHGSGLVVPLPALEALCALGALCAAWQANAEGRPASPAAKAVLGLR